LLFFQKQFKIFDSKIIGSVPTRNFDVKMFDKCYSYRTNEQKNKGSTFTYFSYLQY
jgi:hypothetical protein